MSRTPEIGNVQLYPKGRLSPADTRGYVLRFYCPIKGKRIRMRCRTKDRREAKKIQRECIKRLVNGDYISSGGCISEQFEIKKPGLGLTTTAHASVTWDQTTLHYEDHNTIRHRESSVAHSKYRLDMGKRILLSHPQIGKRDGDLILAEALTLDALEFLQKELLNGAEGRYDSRAPSSVNSIMGAILAFANFCFQRGWIEKAPKVAKLPVVDQMKGRPITKKEFELMREAVPEVVGSAAALSWVFVLDLIWNSGFRLADVMDFCWENRFEGNQRICPLWPDESREHAAIRVSHTQKNGRNQEIAMLPGLKQLLEFVPQEERKGWIANPGPVRKPSRRNQDYLKPTIEDLKNLADNYSNCSVAELCGVTETTVRKWLSTAGFKRSNEFAKATGRIPEQVAEMVRKSAAEHSEETPYGFKRLSYKWVGRVISKIGERAGIVVVHEDDASTGLPKFASAHDIRRGFARRCINAGVSAETLKAMMRHADFATTEKHYGAIRSAQASAIELNEKMSSN